jgi:hypothetical protein
MRKVHTEAGVFEYEIGRQHIKIVPPDGKKIAPTIAEVTGLTVYEVERSKHKHSLQITPGDIILFLRQRGMVT